MCLRKGLSLKMRKRRIVRNRAQNKRPLIIGSRTRKVPYLRGKGQNFSFFSIAARISPATIDAISAAIDAIDALSAALERKRAQDFARKLPPGGIASKVSLPDVDQQEYIVSPRILNDGQ